MPTSSRTQILVSVIQARSTRGARRTAPAVRTVISTMSSSVIVASGRA
jgi:hypothetical protein